MAISLFREKEKMWFKVYFSISCENTIITLMISREVRVKENK
jgi:hypothetical protein